MSIKLSTFLTFVFRFISKYFPWLLCPKLYFDSVVNGRNFPQFYLQLLQFHRAGGTFRKTCPVNKGPTQQNLVFLRRQPWGGRREEALMKREKIIQWGPHYSANQYQSRMLLLDEIKLCIVAYAHFITLLSIPLLHPSHPQFCRKCSQFFVFCSFDFPFRGYACWQQFRNLIPFFYQNYLHVCCLLFLHGELNSQITAPIELMK